MRAVFPIAAMLATAAQAAATQPADVRAVARSYLQAQQDVLQAGAGPAQVEALLGFYTPDFVYAHPAVGARIVGAQPHRDGLTAQLGLTRDAHIEIRDMLVSGNVVAVAAIEHFTTVADGHVETRQRMYVLTIRGGRIAQRVDI